MSEVYITGRTVKNGTLLMNSGDDFPVGRQRVLHRDPSLEKRPAPSDCCYIAMYSVLNGAVKRMVLISATGPSELAADIAYRQRTSLSPILERLPLGILTEDSRDVMHFTYVVEPRCTEENAQR